LWSSTGAGGETAANQGVSWRAVAVGAGHVQQIIGEAGRRWRWATGSGSKRRQGLAPAPRVPVIVTEPHLLNDEAAQVAHALRCSVAGSDMEEIVEAGRRPTLDPFPSITHRDYGHGEGAAVAPGNRLAILGNS